MRHLSLFAGIGGVDLALAAYGVETTMWCEIEPYAQSVLRARVPGAAESHDVRELSARKGEYDIISGGFPCQDISNAGKRAGIEGARSGLWVEYARLIGEARPQLVLIENVAALLRRGIDRVLWDLAQLGYACEWDCIPAAAVGAPHLRDRIWMVAYPEDVGPLNVFGLRPEKSLGTLSLPPTKWPRAGRMEQEAVFLREPCAPRKTRRENGWSYWAGVGLNEAALLALLPTPVANDDNKSPEAHMAMKARMGGGRRAITSLAVIARNGFQNHTGALWPTPKGSAGHYGQPRPNDWGDLQAAVVRSLWPTPTAQDGADNAGPAQFRRNSLPLNAAVALWPTPEASDGSGSRVSAEVGGIRPSGAKRSITLATKVVHVERGLWPTPRASWNENRATKRSPSSEAGTHGRKLAEEAIALSPPVPGGRLNPDWVEWLMGFPLGWTDLSREPAPHPSWAVEPDIPRVSTDIPNRRQRLTCLGNALVPQVMGWVAGRAIARLKEAAHEH